MSSERAQRRANEIHQKQQDACEEHVSPVEIEGTPPLWLTLLVALPVVVVPLYFVYMPAGTLLEGSYGQIIINEFQKYVAELVCLGLLLAGAGFLMVKRNRWPRLPRQVLWPALLYLAAIVVSLLSALDVERGLVNLLQVGLLPLLFFLLLAGYRWKRTHVYIVLGLMLAAGAVVSLIGICQKLEVWGFAMMLPHGGAGSLLFYQNLAGEYLILIIPPAVVLTFMPIHWLFRISAALLSSTFLVHLAMTLARGAWVGLLAGVFISLCFAALGALRAMKGAVNSPEGDDSVLIKKQSKRLLPVVGLLLIIILGTAVWVGTVGKTSDSPYVKELLSINLSSTTGRLQIWSDSLGLLEDHWLTGVGPGHYRIAFPPYLDESPSVSYLFRWVERTGGFMYPLRPHNDYLQNWIEHGLFGLVGMVWLFISITFIATRGIGRAVVSGDREKALMILGFFGAFSAWAMSMLFEFPFRMPASMLLGWLSAGFAVSLSLQYDELNWLPFRPIFNYSAGCVVAFLVVSCFYFAHNQFWSDIYETQAMIAWNKKNMVKGYEWQQKAYGYAPWKDSVGATKARMEMGRKNYQESLKTSRDVLARHPYLLPALWNQGTAARMIGHDKESREAFRKIVEIYPLLPENKKYRKYAGLPSVNSLSSGKD